MANRYGYNNAQTLAPGVVKVFARVTFGAAGAPTLVTSSTNSGSPSRGVVSVTRNGAGIFTFVFGTLSSSLDVYNALLGYNVTYDTIGAPGVPAAPLNYLSGNAVSTVGSASLQLTFLDADTPAATDPGNGEAIYVEFTFKNSSAP